MRSSVNGVTYTWDYNGNLLSDGTRTYTYDQASRLKAAVNGGTTTQMEYNGLGDRLSQTVNGTVTRYTLDPAAGLSQVLSDGTRTYLYGVGRIAQQQIEMQYYGADALGSVRQLYNGSGQILASTRYDPYGTVLSQDGAATSIYGFTGEQLDASTGLEYLRARYYDPLQGRFVSRDVWGGDPTDPMSYNAWNYTNGDPVDLTDPTGLAGTAHLPEELPRGQGVCLEPDPQHSVPRPRAFMSSTYGEAYLYCGEFALTAYQFVEDEGYSLSPIANASPQPSVPAGRPTATPTPTPQPDAIQGTINKVSVSLSLAFALDVQMNGTGHSNNPAVTEVCTDRYITGMTVTGNSFSASCGKGRTFNASDAFQVAASDPNQVPKNAALQIPGLVAIKQGYEKPDAETRYVTVRDTGGLVTGYHLDIFVGQGRGINSFPAGGPINSLANKWSIRHDLPEIIIFEGGKPVKALGPTSVYQRVPLAQLSADLLPELFCGSD